METIDEIQHIEKVNYWTTYNGKNYHVSHMIDGKPYLDRLNKTVDISLLKPMIPEYLKNKFKPKSPFDFLSFSDAGVKLVCPVDNN